MRMTRIEKKERQSTKEYYNSKLKSEFIKSYRDGKDTGMAWNSIFIRTRVMESALNKDCCNFTWDEIDQLFNTFRSSSINTLSVKMSLLRAYTDFCILKGWSVDNQNHYMEFERKDLEKYIDKRKAGLKYYTEDEILEIAKQLSSNRDKYIILGLYYGIIGKDYVDFIHVKKQDLDYKNKVYIERTDEYLDIPEHLYNIMVQAGDEYEHYASNGKAWKLEGDWIYKIVIRKVANANPVVMITKRIEKIKDSLQLPLFSAKIIIQSGFCNQVNKLLKQSGKSMIDVLDTSEMLKLRERYLMPKSRLNVMGIYKQYEYCLNSKES